LIDAKQKIFEDKYDKKEKKDIEGVGVTHRSGVVVGVCIQDGQLQCLV
jgi:hypothetical protein